VILPSFAQCVASPATAGCSAVLPSLTQCDAAPATPGCTVVLPTTGVCTLNPSLPGCTTVLTTLVEAPGNAITQPTVNQTVTETDTGLCSIGGSGAQCNQASTSAGGARVASSAPANATSAQHKTAAVQKCN